MDPRRFDTLAKTLATPGTRRGALAALLAGTLTLLGLAQPALGRTRRERGVTIQGPCGDGSGPDNRCEGPADCCTGICEQTRAGATKRCRCRSKGEYCTRSRNCCQRFQALVCDGGTCQPPEVCQGGRTTRFTECCSCTNRAGNNGLCVQAEEEIDCAALCDAQGFEFRHSNIEITAGNDAFAGCTAGGRCDFIPCPGA